MKPVRELKIKSSLNVSNLGRRPWRLVKRRFSNEHRYFSLLRKIVPEVHKGFLQDFLYLIIEKD